MKQPWIVFQQQMPDPDGTLAGGGGEPAPAGDGGGGGAAPEVPPVGGTSLDPGAQGEPAPAGEGGTPAPAGEGGTPPAGEGAGEPKGGEGEPTPSSLFEQVPDDWRQRMAGGDPKRLKQLERYATPEDVIKAGFEAQDRIRRGELSDGLPENPTEEQLAAWREAHGVPPSPEDYQIEPAEGLVLGEADARILEQTLPVAHKHNISQEALQEMTSAMLKAREHEAQAIQQKDTLDAQTAVQQLKEKWGGDFDTNINLVKNWLQQTMPGDIAELVAGARMPDGRAVFNAPEVLMGLAQAARELNPAATVVPGTNNPMRAITDELAALEKEIGTDEWFKDTAKQARYRELLTAKEKLEQKR